MVPQNRNPGNLSFHTCRTLSAVLAAKKKLTQHPCGCRSRCRTQPLLLRAHKIHHIVPSGTSPLQQSLQLRPAKLLASRHQSRETLRQRKLRSCLCRKTRWSHMAWLKEASSWHSFKPISALVYCIPFAGTQEPLAPRKLVPRYYTKVKAHPSGSRGTTKSKLSGKYKRIGESVPVPQSQLIMLQWHTSVQPDPSFVLLPPLLGSQQTPSISLSSHPPTSEASWPGPSPGRHGWPLREQQQAAHHQQRPISNVSSLQV